jgi:hypothetical protein
VSLLLVIISRAHTALRAVCAIIPGSVAGIGRRTGLVAGRASAVPDHTTAGVVERCEKLIGKARWRARLRIHDSCLSGLLAEASELLDDLDEVLVRRHPVRDAALFAEAARLHRDLARIQASVPSVRRGRPARWSRAGRRAVDQPHGRARPRGR